jgi:hypothetical protein
VPVVFAIGVPRLFEATTFDATPIPASTAGKPVSKI